MEQREVWARLHAERLASMTESLPPRPVPQRLWHVRYWLRDAYVAAALVQDSRVPRLRLYVASPLINTNMELTGKKIDYAAIVAFLALDTVDPEMTPWTDDTPYDEW